MKLRPILILLMLSLVWLSCEHEPFPAPPASMTNDTIQDTTTDPVDTTQVPPVKPCDPDTIYFSRDILPILASNCAFSGCHDAGTASDGVVLNNYRNVVNTGDIRPGDPGGSDLYEMITESDPDDRMPPPPNSRLTADQIQLIRKWIMQGAKDLNCDECDTTAISFQLHIKPIFDQSCIVCHSGATPSGGLLLTNYGNIANAVINNEVIPRTNHVPGYPKMPPSGIKLSDCKLRQIDLWVKAGVPNN